jgi:hypothetical protein
MRSSSTPLVVAALIALASAAGAAAKAKKKGQAVHDPDWAKAPSAIYGRMTAAECHAELGARAISFETVTEAPGVLAPVRIPNGVAGVLYRTELPRDKGRTSPWEVFDCRLVLALHDFGAILGQHGIDEVVIFSAWRPPKKGWPEGKLAQRHPGALAVDVFRLGKRPATEGAPRTWLEVEKHYDGTIGAPSCGADATVPTTAEGKELRAIFCEAAAARLFTSMLTPSYDAAHFNHLHLEVTPDVKWRLVR